MTRMCTEGISIKFLRMTNLESVGVIFVILVGICSAQPDNLKNIPGLDFSVCDVTLNISWSPLPSLAPDFSTVLEWKLINENLTISVHEYKSKIEMKSSIIVTKEGIPTKVLFDNFMEQYAIVKQELSGAYTCDTYQRNSELTLIDNQIWYATTSELFKTIQTSNVHLVGQTVIRGIDVNHYNSCMFIYSYNMTIKVDLYLAVLGWKSPFAPPDAVIPVRIEIRGTENFSNHFHVIGDYLDFKPSPNLDQTMLQQPPGVYCHGYGPPADPRHVSKSFSAVLEKIDLDFKKITYETLYFDADRKRIRRDHKSADGTDSDTFSEYYDFKTGILYTVDTYIGMCTPSTLQKGVRFVSDKNNNAIPNSLVMMTATEVFHLDSNLVQYVGKRLTRGVYCQVWCGLYLDTETGNNNTVEWYFTQGDWVEASGNSLITGALIRMDVWKGTDTKPTSYHVHNMDSTTPPLSIFDLSACFPAKKKTHFIIKFQILGNKLYNDISESFLQDTLHEELSKDSFIDPVRITNIQIEPTDNASFVFVGTLLDQAPIINPYIIPPVYNRISLDASLDFLHGMIDGTWKKNVTGKTGEAILIVGNEIVELSYKHELATTTTMSTPKPTFLVPTLPHSTNTSLGPQTPASVKPSPTPAPPSGPTLKPTPKPTPKPTAKPPARPLAKTTVTTTTKSAPQTPCTCPTKTCPIVTKASTPTPVKCPTVSCPKVTAAPVKCPTVSCPKVTPAPVKCPTVSCPKVTPAPVKCPTVSCPTVPHNPGTSPKIPTSTASPSKSSHQLASHQSPKSSGGVSGGGVAGIAITMLIVGLGIGFLVTRLYHVRNIRGLLQRTPNGYDDDVNY